MCATRLELVFFLLATFCAAAAVDRPLLLFAEKSSGSLYVMDVLTTQYQRLDLTRQVNPIAVAYDAASRTVFWSTVQQQHSIIRSAQLDGTNERLLRPKNVDAFGQLEDTDPSPSTPPAVVDGLAFDPVNRRIYYTDTGPEVICSMDVNGDEHRVLVTQGLEQPRCIVVEPNSRKMYWTDWGTVPHIARANMDDGSNVEMLIQDNVTMGWPNGFAIDASTNEMFWCDGKLGRIEVASLAGTSRRLLSRLDGQHYFGLAIDSDYIYVTNWKYGSILRLSRAGGSVERFGPLFSDVTMNGILYIPATQPPFQPASLPSTLSTTPMKFRPKLTTERTTPAASYTASDSSILSDYQQSQSKYTFVGITWTVEVVAAMLGSLLLGCLIIMMILCFVIGRKSRRHRRHSPPSLAFSSLNRPEVGAGADIRSGNPPAGKTYKLSTATAPNHLTYHPGQVNGLSAPVENEYQHTRDTKRIQDQGHDNPYNKLLIDFTDDDEYQCIPN